MCESFKTKCACGQKTAEIFFGKMVLAESSVTQVYCPKCSQNVDCERIDRVWDNGWVLELDMDVLRAHANSMGILPQEVTAAWVFDQGYATWVGITPDDAERSDETMGAESRKEIHGGRLEEDEGPRIRPLSKPYLFWK